MSDKIVKVCLCKTCQNKECIANNCEWNCYDDNDSCNVTIEGYTDQCSAYKK